jgi:hypothetical protein
MPSPTSRATGRASRCRHEDRAGRTEAALRRSASGRRIAKPMAHVRRSSSVPPPTSILGSGKQRAIVKRHAPGLPASRRSGDAATARSSSRTIRHGGGRQAAGCTNSRSTLRNGQVVRKRSGGGRKSTGQHRSGGTAEHHRSTTVPKPGKGPPSVGKKKAATCVSAGDGLDRVARPEGTRTPNLLIRRRRGHRCGSQP